MYDRFSTKFLNNQAMYFSNNNSKQTVGYK